MKFSSVKAGIIWDEKNYCVVTPMYFKGWKSLK
jgi:hypothetical protein